MRSTIRAPSVSSSSAQPMAATVAVRSSRREYAIQFFSPLVLFLSLLRHRQEVPQSDDVVSPIGGFTPVMYCVICLQVLCLSTILSRIFWYSKYGSVRYLRHFLLLLQKYVYNIFKINIPTQTFTFFPKILFTRCTVKILVSLDR